VTALAPTLQAYFTQRLIFQRQASPHFRLDLADLDAPLIGAFLEHLQAERANSTRTRNAPPAGCSWS